MLHTRYERSIWRSLSVHTCSKPTQTIAQQHAPALYAAAHDLYSQTYPGIFVLETGPYLPATSGRTHPPSSGSTATRYGRCIHRSCQMLTRAPSTPRTPNPLGDLGTRSPLLNGIWMSVARRAVPRVCGARPCKGGGPRSPPLEGGSVRFCSWCRPRMGGRPRPPPAGEGSYRLVSGAAW